MISNSELQVLGRAPFVVFRLVVEPAGEVAPKDYKRLEQYLGERKEHPFFKRAAAYFERNRETIINELSRIKESDARDLAETGEILINRFVIVEWISRSLGLIHLAIELAEAGGEFSWVEGAKKGRHKALQSLITSLGLEPKRLIFSNGRLSYNFI